MRAWLTIAVLLALAAPAQGRLTIYRAGAPLQSVRADGTGLRDQCPLVPDCAQPSPPAWSPDGNELAVGGSIVYANGTCRVCSTFPYFSTDPAAWFPDGRRLADGRRILGDDGLSEGTVTGVDKYDPSPQVAIASDGTVIRQVGATLRVGERIVARQADYPSWSPDGRHLAYQRSNGVFVARADGNHRRRLTTGGAPDWSPDGRRIAFVRDGRAWTVDSRGGRARPVGDVLADRVDWQPRITRGRPLCQFAPGADRVLHERGVIVVERMHPDGDGEGYAWSACLDGVVRTVWTGYDDDYELSKASRFRAAAPYVAFLVKEYDHYGEGDARIDVVDLRTGRQSAESSFPIAGAAPTDYRGLSELRLDADGDTAWIAVFGDRCEVGVQHANVTRVLATGASDEFAGVRLSNGVVTWTDHGQPMSAPIASPR